jgi:hypothetical protein
MPIFDLGLEELKTYYPVRIVQRESTFIKNTQANIGVQE